MILYLEIPEDSTEKLSELLNEFSKVAGCKVNTKNQLHFWTLKMKYPKRKLQKQFHLQYYQKE